MQNDVTVTYDRGITNVVADVLSRRPLSSPTSTATAMVSNDSSFLSNMHFPYMLDTHATAISAKINTGRQVKHSNVEDDLLWFHTKCGLHQLYGHASLRIEVQRNVRDYALAGRGGVHTAGLKVSRPFWWSRMRPAAGDKVLTRPDFQELKP